MWLAPTLRVVADALDEAAALKLAREHGGTRLWIPGRPTAALQRKVGPDVAAALCGYRPNEHLTIPLGPYGTANAARRVANEMIDRGATLNEAALASGLTERTITNIKARRRAEADARQGRLFA